MRDKDQILLENLYRCILLNENTDEEYLRLAENPEENKERLQRMVDEAAKKSGYNLGPAFHGKTADVKINVFDPSKSKIKTIDNYGFNWLSLSEKTARTYSKTPSTPLHRTVNIDLVINALKDEGKDDIPAKDYVIYTSKFMLQNGKPMETDDEVFAKQNYSNAKWEHIGSLKDNDLNIKLKNWFKNKNYYTYDEQDLIGKYFIKAKNPKTLDFEGKRKIEPWGKIAKEEISKGYDALIVNNVNDVMPFMFGEDLDEITTIIGVPKSNQIKSANIITYDDKDNIIPLSQRFDSSKDDINY